MAIDLYGSPVRFGPQFGLGQEDDGASVLRDLGIGNDSQGMAPEQDPEYLDRIARMRQQRQSRGDVMSQLDQLLSQPRPTPPDMRPSFGQTMAMAALPGLGQVFARNRALPYQNAMTQRQGAVEDLSTRLGLYPEPGEEDWYPGGGGAGISRFGRTKLLPQQPQRPQAHAAPPEPGDIESVSGGYVERGADSKWKFNKTVDYGGDQNQVTKMLGEGVNILPKWHPGYKAAEEQAKKIKGDKVNEADQKRIADAWNAGYNDKMKQFIEEGKYNGTMLPADAQEQASAAGEQRAMAMQQFIDRLKAKPADPHMLPRTMYGGGGGQAPAAGTSDDDTAEQLIQQLMQAKGMTYEQAADALIQQRQSGQFDAEARPGLQAAPPQDFRSYVESRRRQQQP